MVPLAGRHPFRTSVAPMVDVTDPYFLRLLRLISPHKTHELWTEMIHANAFARGALVQTPHKLHQSVPIHELRDFAPGIVVQIGASEPDSAYEAVAQLKALGVRHVNLNCGCPSRNVQMGAFGAVLMGRPHATRAIVRAMVDAAGGDMAVSVKCRIGVDESASREFLDEFIETVGGGHASPVRFVVHARRALLDGVSPKDNRRIPQLDHARVREAVAAHPEVAIAVNGGVATVADVEAHLRYAQSVMVGRKVREDPWFLAALDVAIHGVDPAKVPLPEEVLDAYLAFCDRMHARFAARYTVFARALYAFFRGARGRAMRRHVAQTLAAAKVGADKAGATYSASFGEIVREALHNAEREFAARNGQHKK